MGTASIIGQNITKYRKSKKLTQAELAEKIFVTPQNISKWENGYSLPDVQHLCLLADVLGISLDKLTGRICDDVCGKLMIGIDGGGSKTEFCLFAEDGTVLRRKRLGGTNPNVYDINTVQNTLKTGIDLLLDGYTGVAAIFAGIAGCGIPKRAETVLKFLTEQYPGMQIEVQGDSLNSIYSTPYYNSCVVSIVGTGTVIFAKNEETVTRIGGWGYRLETGYGGYYLATEVLRAVMAHEDGIGVPTALTAKLQKKLGGRAVDHIGMIYGKSNDEIAAFAKILFEAFDEGDAVARDIVTKNITVLNKMLHKVFENHPDCDKKLVITGGLANRRDILLHYLEAGEGVELVFPDLPPIYGACHYCAHTFGAPGADFHEAFKNSYKEICDNDQN
ncbi:MAG: XRE family transcriptional regulator [Clostridia bacterium]|nr:XRE family transcriptional regulator [Clostridia bacterium]